MLCLNYKSWVHVRLHPQLYVALETFRCFRPSRGSQRSPQAFLPRPIWVSTEPTSPHLIPASTGGKLREEIGVVPPVSNTALVLDYLNGPLPPIWVFTTSLTIRSVSVNVPGEMSNKLKPFLLSVSRCLHFCMYGLSPRRDQELLLSQRPISLQGLFSICTLCLLTYQVFKYSKPDPSIMQPTCRLRCSWSMQC